MTNVWSTREIMGTARNRIFVFDRYLDVLNEETEI